MSDIKKFFETRTIFKDDDFDLLDCEILTRINKELAHVPEPGYDKLFDELYEDIESGIREVFEIGNVTELKPYQIKLANFYVRDIYELPESLKTKIVAMSGSTNDNGTKELIDAVNESIEVLRREDEQALAAELDLYFNHHTGHRDSLLEAVFYFFNKEDFERARKLKDAYHLERLSFSGNHSKIGNMWSMASAYMMHMHALEREAEENKVERLEEFDFICGFKLLEVNYTEAQCSDGTTTDAIIMTFHNEKHVAVDVLFIDGEVRPTEPYAITDDYEPYKGK